MDVRSIKFAPFAGVVSERPYPATGLTSALWMKRIPTQWVPFHELWLTQEYVKIDLLFASEIPTPFSGDLFPHVVEWDGRYFLEDGHNRIVRAAQSGSMAALCRVFKR